MLSAISGCRGFEKSIQSLNARDGLSTCISYQGTMRAGGIMGGYVAVRGITVTGSADINTCIDKLENR